VGNLSTSWFILVSSFSAGAQKKGPEKFAKGMGDAMMSVVSKRCAETYHLQKSRRAPLALLEGLFFSGCQKEINL